MPVRTVQHIIKNLEDWAPTQTKLSYDNIGLLTGSRNQEVSSILICLDVTEGVVEEAISSHTDLIVAHHPLIFNKITRITDDTSQGRIISSLIKHTISLYASHTNLDAAVKGVSYQLAERLGLKKATFLNNAESRLIRRILFSAPFSREHISSIQTMDGVYHFSELSGKTNKEITLLVECEPDTASKIKAKAEEFTKLIWWSESDVAEKSKREGLGVIGELPVSKPMSQNEFFNWMCKQLKIETFRYSGNHEAIKRVAVCGGSGSMLKNTAIDRGADVYITADVKYHDYFNEISPFLYIDIGHYESEIYILDTVVQNLQLTFPEINVRATQIITNPMKTFVYTNFI